MSESPGAPTAGETTPVPSSDLHGQSDADTMDITLSTTVSMGPPGHSSPDLDPHQGMSNGNATEGHHGAPNGIAGGLSAAAATSSQQPKVVQTAFIHKLYRYYQRAVLGTRN